MTTEDLLTNYKVIRSSRRTLGMEIKDGALLIRAPYFASKREIERFINHNRNWIERQAARIEKQRSKTEGIVPLTEAEKKALVNEAKKVIPERAEYYASRLGVTYGKITIRCQKTRWGSCSAKGNLNFNFLLMLAPLEVLDSVVVHELCHLKEMNHSERFYAEVLKVCPDYRRWDRWLKENGRVLMARAGFGM